jgi:hypothetical protein
MRVRDRWAIDYSRHGVEAAGVPGMAAAEAPQREQAAAEDAEAQQRFTRVL